MDKKLIGNIHQSLGRNAKHSLVPAPQMWELAAYLCVMW